MNNFGFIDPNKKINLCVQNNSCSDFKTFCQSQYLANDKYYKVKHFFDHSVLVEEKSIDDLKIQNFLKTLLTITGLAYLIGMALSKYSSNEFENRSIILTGEIKGYDLKEFMEKAMVFPESRPPHLTLYDGIKREIEACPNKTALANLFVTITSHKTKIVEEFVTQRKFPSRYLEAMSNQLSNLPMEKLINWDFNSEDEMIEFLIIAQWYNKHYQTIIDDGFIEQLIGKSLDRINHSGPHKMAAILEYIQFSFGEEVIRKILLRKIESIVRLEINELPSDWELMFITPHEDLLNLFQAFVILDQLVITISTPDLHLPSFTESLRELGQRLPESFNEIEKKENIYKILQDMFECLAVLPSDKVFDRADLNNFKIVYNSIAERLERPEVDDYNDTSGDAAFAENLQFEEY